MEVINELLKLEDEITIEAGEIATKEVVFENVGMLTLTFEDGSGNPLLPKTVTRTYFRRTRWWMRSATY